MVLWSAGGIIPNGQTTVPAGSYTQVSAGDNHTCGLESDGSLLCWGYNFSGQTEVPAVSYTQVSAGGVHTCGLNALAICSAGGKMIMVRRWCQRESTPRSALGGITLAGCKDDGTLLCWGKNDDGQSTVPAGTYTQVSAGGYHTCGLKDDGTLLCWGNNDYGQTTVPEPWDFLLRSAQGLTTPAGC